MVKVGGVCWPARDGWSEPRVVDGQAAERVAAALMGNVAWVWVDVAIRWSGNGWSGCAG